MHWRAMVAAGRRWSRVGPFLVGVLAMLLGVALRAPVWRYDGPADHPTFYAYLFHHLGAYSDIAALYLRDQLWTHPLPYIDYPLEYPVGTGVLIWLLGFAGGSLASYFLLTAALLLAAGLLTFALASRFPGSNLWLLALSPALALHTVLNWDMVAILLTVAALLLYARRRDGWGALLLTLAVWSKFFPIVFVPLILADRLLDRRWRDALRTAVIFVTGTIAINAPFALEPGAGGLRLRENWLYFFRFNQERPREVNLWNLVEHFSGGLETSLINQLSAGLLAAGVLTVAGTLVWSHRRSGDGDRLVPAALAALGWWFFVNKVYSPQYSLWLLVLLAVLAAPPALVAAFGGIDLAYFAASFLTIHLDWAGSPETAWAFDQVLIPAMLLRELLILSIVAWAFRRLLRPAAAARAGQREPPLEERGAERDLALAADN